ncbi:restriction endonuclease subunit S [Desertivirga xinjiangensis]|uniref:restriction endonuclease subunit S n=1 Tax=Desertivirga xinjiangensis TaxID=539206 RepID=UPI00210AE286|nr:restriction endonuclease subunit S [Pedobacter xinjiangensis]
MNIPKHWELTTLGKVAVWGSGGTPNRSNSAFYGGSIPWIKTGDLNDSVIYEASEFITELGLAKSSAKIFPKGAVGIAMYGATIGKTAMFGIDAATNQACAVAQAREFVSNHFLHYYLKSQKEAFIEKGKGGAQPNISQAVLKEHPFPLPPLAEQKRIVAKLDEAFKHLETLKAKLERIPKLLKKFRQTVLTHAVTGKLTEEWRKGKQLESALNTILSNRRNYYQEKLRGSTQGGKKPRKPDESAFERFELGCTYLFPECWAISNLKNIADFITDGEHATPKRTETGYYLLSARNVQDGYISLEKVDYVPEDEYERIRMRCNPEANDILISCSGTVGRVSIVPENLKFVMVRSAALLKLQSNPEIAKYVEFALRSDIGQSQISRLQKSTAQSNIFLGPIGKIVIPLPPSEEIEEIIGRVQTLFTKADMIAQQYKELRVKIDRLPQTLLAKAFRGELIAQEETYAESLIKGLSLL